MFDHLHVPRCRWLLESNPAEIDAAPDSLAATAEEQEPQQGNAAVVEQQAGEAAAPEFGPVLPPPPDALQMLGQYDDSWQEQEPDEQQQQQHREAALGGELQGDGCGEPTSQEPGGTPSAGQPAVHPAATTAVGSPASAPSAEEQSGRLLPAGVPPDEWAVMCKLVRFVQVRPHGLHTVGYCPSLRPWQASPPP